jgi:hypothetical protein
MFKARAAEKKLLPSLRFHVMSSSFLVFFSSSGDSLIIGCRRRRRGREEKEEKERKIHTHTPKQAQHTYKKKWLRCREGDPCVPGERDSE